MIHFVCPKCETTFSAEEEHAGQRTTCKNCGVKFLIPGGAEPLPYEVEPSASPPPLPPVPEQEPSFLAPPAPEPPTAEPSVPVELAPCPKCQAKMSVRPEDVGFDLQCPFCQTVFLGTAATDAPSKHEPEGIEIAPCPKCRAELTVSQDDLGGEVECPFCQTVYKAEKPQPKPNTLLARPSVRPAAPSSSTAPAPPTQKGRGPRDEDDDDTTPIAVRQEQRVDPDEEDDDRPREKRRKKRRRSTGDPYDSYDDARWRTMEPSSGVACLVMGLFAFFCCALIAFWSIPQCNETIAKVNSGTMEESAKPLAITGLVLSYIGIGIWILNIILICAGGLAGGRR